jgi:RNA polymerase sigma-70 factor (ECF subfamily)
MAGLRAIVEAVASSSESSFELIERAKSGDREALERLMARYRPRLNRWASGRLPQYARTLADTEDIVQDVLLRTVKRFSQFELRGEWALQAYLRRAVINRIRDELDKVHARPPHQSLPETMIADEPSPLAQAVGKELFDRYDNALATLGDIDREAVIARLELGCSYQEIAMLVDKPTADAARVAVSRALSRLAELMSGPPQV